MQSLLTGDDVRRILQLYDLGMDPLDIVEQTGLDRAHVEDVVWVFRDHAVPLEDYDDEPPFDYDEPWGYYDSDWAGQY